MTNQLTSRGRTTPLPHQLGSSVLVIGCQRSGTTLLASMLGSHSQIAMLNECARNPEFQIIGKDYFGNKLLAWAQINIDKRPSKFGSLVNRLLNLHLPGVVKPQRYRLFPTSLLSVKDYLQYGSKIIGIRRKKSKVIKSMITRGNLNNRYAELEWKKANEILNYLDSKECMIINYEDLVKHPDRTMVQICLYLGLEYEPIMLTGCEYNTLYPESSIISSKAS